MFLFPAHLTNNGTVSVVTAFNAEATGDPVFVADSRHPHWKRIIEGLKTGDPKVWALFDVADGVMAGFNAITDRVSYDGSDILWDGDPVHSVLAGQVQRAIEYGEDNYEALALFWEKLETNPSENSKAQAYNWLATHDFKITAAGDVVGYKGVSDSGTHVDGKTLYYSTASSRVSHKPSGYVNGVPVKPLSAIPQTIGDTVTMPRSEVKDDPRQTCERGLHVGDWSYASQYGNARFEVHFNPRDIVSVPVDVGARKVRVSRYDIIALVTGEREGGPVVPTGGTVTPSDWTGVGYSGV